MRKNKKAFTLIELLVVVLIIGILAAVALPQYQKAVYKSRYAMLKNLTKSIAIAQDVYYLANGQYATNFDELDIDIGGTPKNDTKRIFEWGFCSFQLTTIKQAMCHNSDIGMQYQQQFSYDTNIPNARNCIAVTTDVTDIRSQICKAETAKNTNTNGGSSLGYLGWRY